MLLAKMEALIAACEREYLVDDMPDDEDISAPPSGITMGMIRAARKELDTFERARRFVNRQYAHEQRSKQ